MERRLEANHLGGHRAVDERVDHAIHHGVVFLQQMRVAVQGQADRGVAPLLERLGVERLPGDG